MTEKFEIEFLEDALDFLIALEEKTQSKVMYNIEKAKFINDPKVFKKLRDNIWEFRTEYKRLQYRLLAFWDKRDVNKTLVVCTHGFVKKTDQVPSSEIDKAITLMRNHFR